MVGSVRWTAEEILLLKLILIGWKPIFVLHMQRSRMRLFTFLSSQYKSGHLLFKCNLKVKYCWVFIWNLSIYIAQLFHYKLKQLHSFLGGSMISTHKSCKLDHGLIISKLAWYLYLSTSFYNQNFFASIWQKFNIFWDYVKKKIEKMFLKLLTD